MIDRLIKYATIVPMATLTKGEASTDNEIDLWSSQLATDPGFLLARARAVTVRRMNAVLVDLGLNVRSYSVLCLATEEFAPSQRQLSEFLDLDPSQIVSLIDDLESRGLVQRQPHPADRRARQIVATGKGKDLHRTAVAAVAEATAKSFQGLSDSEQDQLRSLLLRLNHSARAAS